MEVSHLTICGSTAIAGIIIIAIIDIVMSTRLVIIAVWLAGGCCGFVGNNTHTFMNAR